MKLHRYVDHQRLHIVTKDVISLSISVLLLFRHYISHKITFGAPSSGGVLRSACGAFIYGSSFYFMKHIFTTAAIDNIDPTTTTVTASLPGTSILPGCSLQSLQTLKHSRRSRI